MPLILTLLLRFALLGAVAGAIRWAARRSRVTHEDVSGGETGAPAKAGHLPSVNPDLHDTDGRTASFDLDSQRVWRTGPYGGG